MQDRPTFDELLEAVAGYLRDDVMPNTQGRLSFHARVSMNVVEMLRRELATMEEHLAREWDGLDRLLGVEPMPPRLAGVREALLRRNADLCERIRKGDADEGPWRLAVLSHLRTVTLDKLEVSNPGLAAEYRDRA
ncbi:DUF6285 domain-containing protein [Tepidiforma sp.]|jgi:hypothetical protein|uniref:DUF6285 domain-containing protein n=1 Tax=Tepidiforma sp. TaxID=2682230 RepID=UPI0021DC4474|nr:DUF6285 domain-containing protein [Tepidiforma sp.]MCX7617518.1 DUF6285 domain-containing protein [Tepidiforma sp.]GIW17672.1 MAG: hypothetical protein KatS3mg064_0829 [Tepidiforma sp.]